MDQILPAAVGSHQPCARKPLAIELFCGKFGWSQGWLVAGGQVVGFDVEHLPHHGPVPKGAELVLQDVLTLHGSQFRNASVIVASPPCQKYSYLAMPWSRSKDPNNSKAAKSLRKEWETNGPDNRLFDACFRIQREASAVGAVCRLCQGEGRRCYEETQLSEWWDKCDRCNGSGREFRYIPLIVENVLGAVPWVGKRDIPLDQWNALDKHQRAKLGQPKAAFGSFKIWGDIAQVGKRIVRADAGFGASGLVGTVRKVPGVQSWSDYGKPGYKATAFNGQAERNMRDGVKVPSFRFDGSGRSFQTASVEATDGTKIGGDWFSDPKSTCRKHGSKSPARKAASAQIAMIPPALSQYVAEMFWPKDYPVDEDSRLRIAEPKEFELSY